MGYQTQILLAVLFWVGVVSAAEYFTPKTETEVQASFKRYDLDRDGVLNQPELKDYFLKDYMKPFDGIEIDPKFIDGALTHIKTFDKDQNGMSPLELYKAVLPDDSKPVSREPHHYPEQEL